MLIGEVSRRAGISARMLRHYDAVGLVSPTGRTVGGYREYSPDDIRRLFHVESLRSLGLSLRDLRRALDDADFTPAGLVGELIASTQDRLTREEELLRRLRHVEDSGPTEWDEVLRIVSLMRGLDSDDPSRRQRSALATAENAIPPVRLLAEAVLEESDLNVAGALRWALRRSNDEALDVLGPALDSPEATTRHRAVAAIAEVDGESATALLVDALGHADPVVRGHSALTLGTRGDTRAIPELIGMVIAGSHDVEAAEALGELAREHDLDDRIAGTIAKELRGGTVAARQRLTQALAELHGPVSLRTLQSLTEDPERGIAVTATSLVKARDGDPA
jgi:DNA-binding transcriptional MerR regulator